MKPTFIHLRIHSEFSLVDGIVRLKPLVKALGELDMPAAAVTEQCNLFSLVKFYSASRSAGIKPVCRLGYLSVQRRGDGKALSIDAAGA